MSPLSSPPSSDHPFRRVAILFAGGPAPAANAVISTAAAAFLHNGIEVVGILHGYSHLVDYRKGEYELQEGRDYRILDRESLRRTRNKQGILVGTARTNPGKDVSRPEDLKDKKKSAQLQTVYDALRSIGVDALISIGGDDTLKTANKLRRFQDHLPQGSRRIPVVHLPKTIDNDYRGIDFTFGFFTAVETLASEIRNLLADAEANRSYFLVETMGRSAGWLAYGAAIAGEASLVVSVEDIVDSYRDEETILKPKKGQDHIADDEARETPANGESTRSVMNMDAVVKRIVRTMRVREEKEGKEYGVIVIAEGLAEYLPEAHLEGIPRDTHGHLSISEVNLVGIFSKRIREEYEEQTQRERKITGLQLGYEARCARPHAFDVLLGSQLGVGSYRALVEERLDGVMVSVAGQLDLTYVPFDELIDSETLVTVVRHIEPNSDFQRLARFVETNVSDEG